MGHEEDWEDNFWDSTPRHSGTSGDIFARDAYEDLKGQLRVIAAEAEVNAGLPVTTAARRQPGKLDGIYEADLVSMSGSKFLDTYLDRTGKCFSTEVRDSGIYICGAHKEVWVNATPGMKGEVCPHVMVLVGDAEESVKAAAAELVRKNSGTTYVKQKKVDLFEDYDEYGHKYDYDYDYLDANGNPI